MRAPSIHRNSFDTCRQTIKASELRDEEYFCHAKKRTIAMPFAIVDTIKPRSFCGEGGSHPLHAEVANGMIQTSEGVKDCER